MPAALKVKLSLEEDKRLLEISQIAATGKRVKQRAEAIRLSSHGWKVAQISEDYLIWGIEDALLHRYDSLSFDTSYFEFSYA